MKKSPKKKAKTLSKKTKRKPSITKIASSKKTKRKGVVKKAKAGRRSAVKKTSEKRRHRRYDTPDLWITEFSGDYRFLVRVLNLSESGIFIKGRLKTTNSPSQLLVPTRNGAQLELTAHPVHDRLTKNLYGTGYKFSDLSATQSKALKSFLRNLN